MELVVALVAVVVLVAGLLQITALARERLRTIQAARERVASMARGGEWSSMSPSAQLMLDWVEGPDGRPMSADDRAISTTPVNLRDRVLRHARPEELADWVPGNPFTRAAWEDEWAEAFGLVRGTARSDPVPLLPVTRRLLYRADEIRVTADVTGVWLEGVE